MKFPNFWVIFWFVFGILFIVLGIIDAANGNEEKSIALAAIAMVCHARCEVKALQQRVDNNG